MEGISAPEDNNLQISALSIPEEDPAATIIKLHIELQHYQDLRQNVTVIGSKMCVQDVEVGRQSSGRDSVQVSWPRKTYPICRSSHV